MLSQMVYYQFTEPSNICHMTGIDVVFKKIQVFFFFLLFSLNVTMAKNIVRWYEGDYRTLSKDRIFNICKFITTDMFMIKEYMSFFYK